MSDPLPAAPAVPTDHPPRSPLRRAAAVWRTGRDRVWLLAGHVRRIWRRSLQVRVVTTTLVASSLLVGAFGTVVAWRSTQNLMNATERDVSKQVHSGARYAYGQLSVHAQPYEPQLREETLPNTLLYLAGTPEQGSDVVVAFRSVSTPTLGTFAVPDVDVDPAISPELQGVVSGAGSGQPAGRSAYQIVTRDLRGSGHPITYLVYGAPVPTRFGQVELYYLVPLTTEQQVAGQIRTTVLVTGVALVVLLAVLAALVTRLVVNPVRVAARTAQRLSAGLLDQRMTVSGEDDLAMLATSFNQMAENLQRQIVRLEEMSRVQRRFTSDVSHELRTPLTTVRMAADLIYAERASYDPAVARSAELLEAELDRFEELLTDLLEISRFDAGFAALDAEPTDLAPLVRRVVEQFGTLADRAGVRLRVALPDEPVIAEIDSRRVERVLRNLVGNAVEHAEGNPVMVTLVADEVAVAVTVRDHGVGLKPGEEKLVFNRFWRSDPSRARQTGGTGLGLSISLEDARLHGGWLEAWGAPGQGAQFRLTLPVRAGDRLSASPAPLVPPDARADDDLAPPPAVVAGAAQLRSLAGPPTAGDSRPGAGDGPPADEPSGRAGTTVDRAEVGP